MELTIEELKIKKPQDRKIDPNEFSSFEKLLELHGGTTIAERKYDGNGILIDTRNLRGEAIHLYSLSKNVWDPACLPELTKELALLPPGFFIGELVGKPTHDNFTNQDEFAAVSARPLTDYSVKLSSKIDTLAKEKPLEIKLYDILALDGEILATLPNYRVRERLEEVAGDFQNISPVERRELTSPEELQQYFFQQMADNKEGLVVKNPCAVYAKEADFVKASRNQDWVKLKKTVTFDLAVLGFYQTEARLQHEWPCSNLLLGTYNEQSGRFETMAKLNLPSKDLAREIFQRVAPHCHYTWNEESPHYWQNNGKNGNNNGNNVCQINKSGDVFYSPKMEKISGGKKTPFMYVANPKQDSLVVEVSAMEITSPKDTWHSCGYLTEQKHSLRQPKFLRLREKTPLEATTTQQIKKYLEGM